MPCCARSTKRQQNVSSEKLRNADPVFVFRLRSLLIDTDLRSDWSADSWLPWASWARISKLDSCSSSAKREACVASAEICVEISRALFRAGCTAPQLGKPTEHAAFQPTVPSSDLQNSTPPVPLKAARTAHALRAPFARHQVSLFAFFLSRACSARGVVFFANFLHFFLLPLSLLLCEVPLGSGVR